MAYDERLENPVYELINGVEVMLARPSTNHDIIQQNLSRIIGNYLRGKRCRLFGEVDVYLDEQNHYIPDLMIVCDRNKIKGNGIHGAPDLIVEILSPRTSKDDFGTKKDIYEKHGVKEYWIISPKEKSIMVYLLEEGKFELDNVYNILEDWEEEALNEQEKAEHKLKLKVSLYDDLEIDVEEVFEDMI